MKSDRIERLLVLIRTLETGRPRTVRELAERTGVSRRTVFRDLSLLNRAGIHYTYDNDSKRYSAARTTLLPPVTLSSAEALSLLLAARNLLNGVLLPDTGAVASAALKLESMLPSSLRDYCGPIVDRMDYRPDPASDSSSIADTISALQTALASDQKIFVAYDSYREGHVLESVLHPYRLAYIHRGWYLVAYSEDAARVQTYKVERILRIRLLDATFTPAPDFSLDDYFGNAWLMIRGEQSYDVKIRFQKKVAANVDEVLWHRTQQTRFQDDGSLVFEVTVDGIEEISWWVLGYGDQALVVEPPELRKLIAERVASMHAQYNGRGDHPGTPAKP